MYPRNAKYNPQNAWLIKRLKSISDYQNLLQQQLRYGNFTWMNMIGVVKI